MGDFSGSPRKATVTFAVPFPNANYSVVADPVTINDRGYLVRIESKTAAGFVVNLGTSNISSLDHLSWTAQPESE